MSKRTFDCNELYSREDLVREGFAADHLRELFGPPLVQEGREYWLRHHVEHIEQTRIAPALRLASYVDVRKRYDTARFAQLNLEQLVAVQEVACLLKAAKVFMNAEV